MSWPNGYTYRATITVDHTKCGSAGNLASFPVHFAGAPQFATVANGGYAQNSSGYDIVFSSDPLGATPLSWELIIYNQVTGEMEAYINAGTGASQVNSTTDAVIYVFIGKTGVSTFQSTATAAWDSFFKGVYHLGDGTTLTAQDSTSNAKHGTLVNTPTPTTTGMPSLGGAALNGASSQYITMGNNLNISTEDFTLEYWVRSANANLSGPVVGKRNNTSFEQYQSGLGSTSGGNFSATKKINFLGYNPTNAVQGRVTTSDLINGGTLSIAVTRTSSGFLMYQGNAAEAVTVTDNGVSSQNFSNTGAFNIGFDNGSRYLTASVDEVRISIGIARSASWLLASYNAQNSPATFYALGAFAGVVNQRVFQAQAVKRASLY